ncbi:MAG: VWA domain-containing protein [Gemmataceae bacterium]|nr:VWA domain-containing protein [Gemmataceae bacterium]MCI0738846.1 VWA domain-containing protein [Gemmataceae bacterium]
MTFVFPVLLGGLALIGIPVLLHLILRQKPKTLLFPAFQFLLQKRRTNLRKLQLRHLLLLTLRVLLIALVCLALARPRLFVEGLGLSSDRPVAVVLLFDTSPSMDYKTSDGVSRLDEAKKRGAELVNTLPDGSRVLILETSDAPASQRGDWLTSMGQVRERIKGLKVRPAAGSFLPTLEQAYRYLGDLARSKEDDTSRFLPRIACVLTDRTRAAWDASRVEAVLDSSDRIAPTLEGLRQTRGTIPALADLLKELRAQLPPPPGRDYPEQALLNALDQLRDRVPGLSKSDFPPDEKLMQLTQNILKRTRDLANLLDTSAEDENTSATREEDASPTREQDTSPKRERGTQDVYRAKLQKSLHSLWRDLRGAETLVVDVGLDQPIDLAVVNLEFPKLPSGEARQLFGEEETILLRALVKATGRDFSTTLLCQLDKKTIQQPVDLKADEQKNIAFEIDLEALKLTPGFHQIEIKLATSDLMAFNNRRFATIAVRQPRRVLVITDDPKNAESFVKALDSLPQRFVTDNKTPQDAERADWLRYHVVYLLGVSAPRDGLWELAHAYLLQGGSVGVVPGGDDMRTDIYNQQAAQKILPGLLQRKEQHGKDDNQNTGALWNLGQDSIFQHPLMSPFQRWRENSNIDFISSPTGAFSFWEVTPQAKDALVLVQYADENKRPALLERKLASDKGRPGKVLLFTTPLDSRAPLWNNYLRNSFYLTVIGLCTNYLAGATEEPQLNFPCGHEPDLALPLAARYPSFTLYGPDTLEQIPAGEKPNILRVKQLTAPGNYSLDGKSGDDVDKRIAAFSLNVASAESDLSRVPLRELAAVLGPDALVPMDRQASLRDALGGHWNEPVELFPWLMMALLVALALENLLANKFYRRESVEFEDASVRAQNVN